MENQHRKIIGYRELTQEDIDLMNLIKIKGRELLELQAKVDDQIHRQMLKAEQDKASGYEYGKDDVDRLMVANPQFWARQAKTDFQVGIMKLIRAVAQPTDC